MGFEEEAAACIPDRECIPRGFPRNLLFVNRAAWDERGSERVTESSGGGEKEQGRGQLLLRCMFVVGSAG